MKADSVYLLVDDDIDDIDFFLEALEEINENIRCHIAHDGEEALNLLRFKVNELPDLIFLDLNMPRMNGFTCLNELKKDKRLQHIPVIINSTSTHQKDRDECSRLGAAYFMQKATTLGKLCANIVSVIKTVNKNANLKGMFI